MATKVDVVMRAFQDDRFRTLLFEHPDKALAEFKLSKEDELALRKLDPRHFEAAQQRIDQDLYNRLIKGDIENPSVSENAGIWDAVDP
jgi:hypothetical protein